jgi:formylglycine-generating enzyme required for sulfatase activity
MNDEVIDILIEIRKNHGKSVFDDARRLKSLLADYAAGQYKGEIRILLIAMEDGLPIKLRNSTDLSGAELRQRAAYFAQIYGLTEDAANFVVNAWARALGLSARMTSVSQPRPNPHSTSMPTQHFEIEMVSVKGGTFTMGGTPEQGSDGFDDEKPAHRVTVGNFRIGRYEVTQAQWKMVTGSNPSYFKGADLPVEQVSWDDVQEFIRKLNKQTGRHYRLPTEAEWEYAARGGSRSKGYKYSGSNDIDDVAWYNGNSGRSTHKVGTKEPNELELHDMSGNVWEWCRDWYGRYGDSAQTNPRRASSGSARVLRGGSWDFAAQLARSANRIRSVPGSRSRNLGFRLAASGK